MAAEGLNLEQGWGPLTLAELAGLDIEMSIYVKELYFILYLIDLFTP